MPAEAHAGVRGTARRTNDVVHHRVAAPGHESASTGDGHTGRARDAEQPVPASALPRVGPAGRAGWRVQLASTFSLRSSEAPDSIFLSPSAFETPAITSKRRIEQLPAGGRIAQIVCGLAVEPDAVAVDVQPRASGSRAPATHACRSGTRPGASRSAGRRRGQSPSSARAGGRRQCASRGSRRSRDPLRRCAGRATPGRCVPPGRTARRHAPARCAPSPLVPGIAPATSATWPS